MGKNELPLARRGADEDRRHGDESVRDEQSDVRQK
jgi:hypothetical protein